MKGRRFFVIVVLSAFFLLSGYILFASDTVPQTENVPSNPVRTIELSSVSFQETAELSGFLRGEQQTDIAPKTDGFVVKLLKEEGEKVRQGETVAILDGAELSAAKESSLLSLRAMERAISESRQYYDQKVDEAKTTLDNTSAFDERDSAEEALRSTKRFRDAQLATLEAEKAALEGSLVISETNASDMIVRAPFSGIITRKHTAFGAFISAGTPIYSVASPDAWEITASIPTALAGRTMKGSPVSVSDDTTTALGYIFSAVSAATEVSQQSIARIRLSASSEAASFSLGEHVRVSFPVGAPRNTLLIPETAILSVYDDTFVYVIEDGKAKKRPVVLGAASKHGREVVSGLSEGMLIVVEGMHTLSDNQPVDEIHDTL